MTVEYRDIPGHLGYQAGTDWTRWVKSQRQYILGNRWYPMKPQLHKSGYLVIRLWDKSYRVHRLILETFIGPCPEGMEACHFPDVDKTNNNLSNLCWAPRSDNSKHKYQ